MVIATSAAKATEFKDEDLREAIELLFFAYRDFTAEGDAVLAEMNFGRAHHRVIYFVGQYPGMRVSDLLEVLQITKQSLSRVLRQLVQEEYIEQRQGKTDRRQRLLSLTNKGVALERQLTSEQRARIGDAFSRSGEDAVNGFRTVMMRIMDQTARQRFENRHA